MYVYLQKKFWPGGGARSAGHTESENWAVYNHRVQEGHLQLFILKNWHGPFNQSQEKIQIILHIMLHYCAFGSKL
jgi:hypothetical protein